MSYSYRRCVGRSALLLLAVTGGSADAAQMFFQPLAEVGVQADTNRNLIFDGDQVNKKSTAGGYSGLVGATWGIATPRSESTLRPEVAYSNSPQIHFDSLRTRLDLNSQFHGQRTHANIGAQFDRQSTTSSELPNPEFNPVNPNLPTTPETGRISTDATRTLVTVAPDYAFAVTRRLNWGLTGIYQSVDYSGTNAGNYVPYQYYLGGTSLDWAVSQRVGASIGVFGSGQSTRDGSGSVDGKGVDLGFSFKWSKQFTGRLHLTGERHVSDVVRPVAVHSSFTGVGATFSTDWKGQVSRLVFSLGRTFTPSGAGGIFSADQLRYEYKRDITQRLAFVSAGRIIRYQSVLDAFRTSNYDYVTAGVGLKWRMTPVWYLQSGVDYLRERFEAPVRTADNTTIYANVGYEGLGRRY